tara:strand:+ start:70 stop:1890 length:1821 start_codon:yes stop_codon:yes gene_type:complete
MKSVRQFIREKKEGISADPWFDDVDDEKKGEKKSGSKKNKQGKLKLDGGKSSEVPSGPPPSGEKVNRGPGRPVGSKNKSKGPTVKQGELDFSSKGAGSGNIGGKETEFRSTSGKNNINQKPQKPSDVIKGAEQSAQGQKARTDAIKGGANKQPSTSQIKSVKGKLNQNTLFNRLTGRYSRPATRQGEKPQEPRRRTGKSVAQIKAEIEAKDKAIADRKEAKRKLKLKNTTVKGSTFKGNKPPVLPKPTPVPGGGTAHTNPQSMLRIPRKSTSKFDSSFNSKAPDSSNPNRIDQREVSKRAKEFTKDTNTARIEKLSKRRVKIDYGMSKPEKGIVARKVDPPKVKTQLSPDTLRSTNPKSNINTPYDKSKATKTFKDMATDSRSKISRKGIFGRSKDYVKNLTNKIKNTFKSKTKVTTTTPKSTPKTRGTSKITSSGGKEIRSKLDQINKKPKTKFKLGSPAKITGALIGYSAYQQEREAGSSQRRSASSGILQGLASAGGYQVVSNLAKSGLKYAPVPVWVKGVGEIGAGLVGSTAAQDKMKQAYDYVFPSKNKKTKTTKNNNKLFVPPIISKKKSKPVDLSNTTLSLTGYDPSLDKNKKIKKDKK